jgi:hypothetical protein
MLVGMPDSDLVVVDFAMVLMHQVDNRDSKVRIGCGGQSIQVDHWWLLQFMLMIELDYLFQRFG